MTHKISRNDIAAMEVVADRYASFNHHLNLRHIDIRWILDTRRPEPRSISRHSTPRTDVDASSIPPMMSPSDDSAAVVNATHEDPDEGGAARPPSRTHSATDMPSDRGHSPSVPRTADSTASFKPPLQFLPPPDAHLSLATFDRSINCEDKPASLTLINSPRSAYTILKAGYNVPDICGVPKQQFYNQGLLDGVTVETVKMRIDAEEERRATRFAKLLQTFAALCSQLSTQEFVDALRHNKYGHVLQKARDEAQLRRHPIYSHPGRLDITVLDTDCVDVLVKTRERTLGEIRRVLDQKDRLLRQSIEREHFVFGKERITDQQFQQSQAEIAQAREEKARIVHEKREVVQNRVKQLILSRREQIELKREALLQQRSVKEGRVKENLKMNRHATLAFAVNHARRRLRVKKLEEELREQRREALIKKSELISRIVERQMEKKKEHLAERSAKFDQLAKERRVRVQQAAESEAEERQRKLDESLSVAAQRTKEFEYIRQCRLDAKRETAERKFARGVTTRMNAEAIKKQRIQDLDDERRLKQELLERALEERKRQITLEKELGNQERIEKLQEKDRVTGSDEFSFIGFMNSNESKREWIGREVSKRATLAAQVRQEREAMLRAKDQIIREIDSHEIERQKKECPSCLQ